MLTLSCKSIGTSIIKYQYPYQGIGIGIGIKNIQTVESPIYDVVDISYICVETAH